MKIKPGVFPRYRIRKDLKSFDYGGFINIYLGLECTIVNGPYFDEVFGRMYVEIEFHPPQFKNPMVFRMSKSEIEEICE